MTRLPERMMVALAALTLASCGMEPDEAGGEQEPGGDSQLSSSTQALTNVNNCATGDTANATSNLGSSEGYQRNRSFANPGGPCPSPRATTIVDFLAISNTKYRFNMTASFPAAHTVFDCFSSRVALRTLRSTSGGWDEVDYQEVIPTWSGSSCFGSVQHVLTPSEYANNGDYRVRARAIRHDGTFETVSIIGALWQ
jgi:hypothetical protein